MARFRRAGVDDPSEPPVRITRWLGDRWAEDWPEQPDVWAACDEWARQLCEWADSHGGEVGPVGAVDVFVLLRHVPRSLPPDPARPRPTAAADPPAVGWRAAARPSPKHP